MQNTIAFADSQTENRTVEACTAFQPIVPDPIVSFADFFPFANLAILITSLPLFFNRSLQEGKIGTMKLWDVRFSTTVTVNL